MDQDRRGFLQDAGKFILLTGAATIAWDYVVAGASEQAPNYVATDHWWAMIIDIDKCIGCGNCVRACKAENDVPLEAGYFRTWVERYHVDPDDHRSPARGFAQRRLRRVPRDRTSPATDARCSSCRSCATTAWIRPARRCARSARPSRAPTASCSSTRTYCLGCRYCVQACPYGCRYIDPRTHTADKCTLCYHRITKGLTTACCEVVPDRRPAARRPEEPEGSRARVPPRRTRSRCSSRRWRPAPKVYYNGLDGSVR